MSVLRALRLLILGETWMLPIGVLAGLLASTAMRANAPVLWRDAGGFVLLAGVVAVLAQPSLATGVTPAMTPEALHRTSTGVTRDGAVRPRMSDPLAGRR